MEIVNKINEAYKKAMLDKDTFTRDTLKLVKAAFLNIEKANPAKPTTEAEYINALSKMVKTRRDNAEQYPDTTMAFDDNAEAVIIEQFLPQQLSRNEVIILVSDMAMDNNLVIEKKNMGLLVKLTVAASKGGTDGKTVSSIINEIISSRQTSE